MKETVKIKKQSKTETPQEDPVCGRKQTNGNWIYQWGWCCHCSLFCACETVNVKQRPHSSLIEMQLQFHANCEVLFKLCCQSTNFRKSHSLGLLEIHFPLSPAMGQWRSQMLSCCHCVMDMGLSWQHNRSLDREDALLTSSAYSHLVLGIVVLL